MKISVAPTPGKPTAISEQAIQRAVFQNLKIRAAPGVFGFHVPNGGWRSPTEAAIFKGIGVVPGIPDVLVLRAGGLYGLELKSVGGKLSDRQRQTLDLMEKAGAITGLAHGIDEALAWLEQHGLLRGRAAS